VAAEPWTGQVERKMADGLLNAIDERIKAGYRAKPDDSLSLALPWSAKLENRPRSVKNLLEAFGIATKAAQETALKQLELRHGMLDSRYKHGGKLAGGLKIGGMPDTVTWIDHLDGSDLFDGSDKPGGAKIPAADDSDFPRDDEIPF
jgi:hypothetical protein